MKRNWLLTVLLAGGVLAVFQMLPPSTAMAADDKHEHDDEHKGEKKDLGTQKIGGFDVQVVLVGDVKSGEEAIFIISPQGQGEPKTVRAWVGVESGQGSIKTKADQEKEGEWHAHHPVSKPLPAGSNLWIELETAAGKQRGSFDLKH